MSVGWSPPSALYNSAGCQTLPAHASLAKSRQLVQLYSQNSYSVPLPSSTSHLDSHEITMPRQSQVYSTIPRRLFFLNALAFFLSFSFRLSSPVLFFSPFVIPSAAGPLPRCCRRLPNDPRYTQLASFL